jgi:hypothetical protein
VLQELTSIPNEIGSLSASQMRIIILATDFLTLMLLLLSIVLLFKAARAASRTLKKADEMYDYLRYIYGDAARSTYPPKERGGR